MKREWTTEDGRRYNTISNGYIISVYQAIRGVIVVVAQQDQGQEYRERHMHYAIQDKFDEDKLDAYTTAAAKAHSEYRKVYHRSLKTHEVYRKFKYDPAIIDIKG